MENGVGEKLVKKGYDITKEVLKKKMRKLFWYLITSLNLGWMILLIFLLVIAGFLYQMEEGIGGTLGSQSSYHSENFAGYGLPKFINEEMVVALLETQSQYGIPVSSGIAQIIAESGFGSYGDGLSRLAFEQKNLFGIKYFSGDQYAIGSKNYHTGEQYASGGMYTIQAGFSIYPSFQNCIYQRAWMLQREPYYSKTIAKFKNRNDGTYTREEAIGFASGIREAGWATSLAYVEHLVKLMDTYNLYQFDNMTKEAYQPLAGEMSELYEATDEMRRIQEIAMNNQGTFPCTLNYCAAWVTGVYQAAHAQVIPYGDAIVMWERYQHTGSTSMDNIPIGAIVCGSGSGYMGSIYGHVGIYIGNGKVANNIGRFSIEDIHSWVSWQTANCRGHVGWIGWVYPGRK